MQSVKCCLWSVFCLKPHRLENHLPVLPFHTSQIRVPVRIIQRISRDLIVLQGVKYHDIPAILIDSEGIMAGTVQSGRFISHKYRQTFLGPAGGVENVTVLFGSQ